jgi:hypothetical protein
VDVISKAEKEVDDPKKLFKSNDDVKLSHRGRYEDDYDDERDIAMDIRRAANEAIRSNK